MKKLILLISMMLLPLILLMTSFATGPTINIGTGSGFLQYDGTGQSPSVIIIKAGTYSGINLLNVVGTPTNYVTIINGGGQVLSTAGSDAGILLSGCQYVHFTGTGDPNTQYGFKSIGGGTGSFDATYGTSDVEIDHLECGGSSYAGLLFRTYPGAGYPAGSQAALDACKWSVSGGWAIHNMIIHDNYVHDVSGEAMYLGCSHYGNVSANAYDPVNNPLATSGYPCAGGNEAPIIGAKIYNNIIKNVGYDGIQLGGCISGCSITGNTIINFATALTDGQDGGITLNPGTVADLVDRNYIEYDLNGPAMGIMFQGQGDTYITNNILAGSLTGTGFNRGIAFLRNTMANVSGSTHQNVFLYNNTLANWPIGYSWFGDNGFNNKVFFGNNIVACPVISEVQNGNISGIQKSTNDETTSISEPKFVDAANKDFRLAAGSPDAGKGTVQAVVVTDYNGLKRVAPYDIGAFSTNGLATPITLGTFTANLTSSNKVSIAWTTQTESNNDHFIIQRSYDQTTWTDVASIPTKADNGNSSQVLSYGPYIFDPNTSYISLAAFGILAAIFLVLTAIDKRNFKLLLVVVFVGSMASCYKSVDKIAPGHDVEYFRLKQVDKDTHSSVTAVRAIHY